MFVAFWAYVHCLWNGVPVRVSSWLICFYCVDLCLIFINLGLDNVAFALFQLCMLDALMLAGARHPDFAFNFVDPTNIGLEMRAYSNTEFGYLLAFHTCAWCTGPLCVSYLVGFFFLSPLFYLYRFYIFFCVCVFSCTWNSRTAWPAPQESIRMSWPSFSIYLTKSWSLPFLLLVPCLPCSLCLSIYDLSRRELCRSIYDLSLLFYSRGLPYLFSFNRMFWLNKLF